MTGFTHPSRDDHKFQSVGCCSTTTDLSGLRGGLAGAASRELASGYFAAWRWHKGDVRLKAWPRDGQPEHANARPGFVAPHDDSRGSIGGRPVEMPETGSETLVFTRVPPSPPTATTPSKTIPTTVATIATIEPLLTSASIRETRTVSGLRLADAHAFDYHDAVLDEPC